jgi:hypothetical protein
MRMGRRFDSGEAPKVLWDRAAVPRVLVGRYGCARYDGIDGIAETDHPACEHWRTGTEPLGHPTSVGADDLMTAPCRAWGQIPRHL